MLDLAPGIETEIVGGPPRWPRDIILSTKVGTNFVDSGGRSVGIVRSRTKGHGVNGFSTVRYFYSYESKCAKFSKNVGK
jgi:hypothetical protein